MRSLQSKAQCVACSSCSSCHVPPIRSSRSVIGTRYSNCRRPIWSPNVDQATFVQVTLIMGLPPRHGNFHLCRWFLGRLVFESWNLAAPYLNEAAICELSEISQRFRHRVCLIFKGSFVLRRRYRLRFAPHSAQASFSHALHPTLGGIYSFSSFTPLGGTPYIRC
jgi:hypothetical protein